MKTRDIDTRLQRYTAAEHRIGANLHELEQHTVYQLLKTDVLVGVTAKRLSSATEANPSLWELFTLLSTTLEQGRKLRGPMKFLDGREILELAKWLEGPSVSVRREAIPLSERGLTAPPSVDERITIEQLIDRMSALYEPIRDVVTQAEMALRGVLPRLNSAEATVNALGKDVDALGLRVPELDRIKETIARVRDLSLTDPLSIPATARDDIDQAVHAASATITTARSSHDELAGDLAAASDLLDQCRDLIAQATQSQLESLKKTASPIGLRQPPSPEAIDGEQGLAVKLGPILASTKPWQALRHDLDRWALGATRLRDQLTRVAQANQRPLDQRDELRGRLSAFRAKMAATGYSEDFVLRDIAAEAHNELFTTPTDLVRADRLVTEFGNRLATS